MCRLQVSSHHNEKLSNITLASQTKILLVRIYIECISYILLKNLDLLVQLGDEGWLHGKALLVLQYSVDEAILHGLMRLQVLDSLAILLHNIDGLSTGKELAHGPTVRLDLPGLDGNIGGLSPGHRHGLVEEDRSIGKSRSTTSLTLCEKHGCGPERLAKGDSVDGRSDVFHNIGNSKGLGLEANGLTSGRRGSRRVDVHGDGVRCRLTVQTEKLSNHKLGNGRNKRHANVNDAIVQQEGREIRRGADADT